MTTVTSKLHAYFPETSIAIKVQRTLLKHTTGTYVLSLQSHQVRFAEFFFPAGEQAVCLVQKTIDMVIMGHPPEGLNLDATSFMENPLVVIAAPDHSLAHAKRIPLKRLQQETFLVREQGSGTRMAMERFFSAQNIKLTTGSEMGTNEAIKQAVQADMGLGILSLHTVALELETEKLVILDVQSFPIMRDWYVVHRIGKRLTATAQMFKAFLLKEGALIAKAKGFK